MAEALGSMEQSLRENLAALKRGVSGVEIKYGSGPISGRVAAETNQAKEKIDEASKKMIAESPYGLTPAIEEDIRRLRSQ